MDDYVQDPVCALSEYNYKIESAICTSADTQLDTLCVIYTGTGPNLIRTDHLTDEVLLRL